MGTWRSRPSAVAFGAPWGASAKLVVLLPIDAPPLTEDRIGSQEVLRGVFLHAFRDQVRLPDGSTATREYVVHPGAVMVIPLREGADGVLYVVLERQFRYPVGRTMVELPAGKLDLGESSQACAQRELREETGYRATHWARAGVMHPCIAYSTEYIDVWFAKGLQPGARALDDGEFLDVFELPVPDFLHACLDGSVTDAKTLVGALWLQNYLQGRMVLHWQAHAIADAGV